MRTRSKILEDLKNSLMSPTWARLKNALLGRELLAYGTEVIHASEQVKESLIQSLKYETADFVGLTNLANMNDVCVSRIRPSYIRVGLAGSNTVYKPFDLVLQSGTSVFTNIEYCMAGEEVTLYQGVVKDMCKEYQDSTEDFLNLRVDYHNQTWDEIAIPSSDTTIYRYLPMDKAYPDSIHLFKNVEGTVTPVSRYTPMQYGPDLELYKIKTLPDGRIAVELGDGVWAADTIDTNRLQLIWLELSNNEFIVGEKLTSTEFGDVEFTVLATSQGSNDDIKYARDFYRKQILDATVVASRQQIREFVNGYPYVLDSSVVPNEEGVINIYVKPLDPNDESTYGEVELALAEKGSMFVRHDVRLGIPAVVILSIKGVPESKRNIIQKAITEEYAYPKLKFDDRIDAAVISGFIQAKFGISTLVRFYVSQAITDTSIQPMFIPEQGSLKIMSGDTQVGWDSMGSIEGVNSGDSISIATAYNSSPVAYCAMCFAGVGESVLFALENQPKSNNAFNILDSTVISASKAALFNVKDKTYRKIGSLLKSALDSLGGNYAITTNVITLNVGDDYIAFMASQGSTGAFEGSWVVVFEKSSFWNYPQVKLPKMPIVFSGLMLSIGITTITQLQTGKLYNNIGTYVFVNGRLLNVTLINRAVAIYYCSSKDASLMGDFYTTFDVSTAYSYGQESQWVYNTVCLWNDGDDLYILTNKEEIIKVKDVTTYGAKGLAHPLTQVYMCENPVCDTTYTSLRWATKQGDSIMVSTWTGYTVTYSSDGKIQTKYFSIEGIKFKESSFRYVTVEQIFNQGNVDGRLCYPSEIPTQDDLKIIPSKITLDTVDIYANNYLPITVTDKSAVMARYYIPKLSWSTGDYLQKAEKGLHLEIVRYDKITKNEVVINPSGFSGISATGTVDYVTGEINFNSNVQGTLEFESTVMKEGGESTYVKLSEQTPVVWK